MTLRCCLRVGLCVLALLAAMCGALWAAAFIGGVVVGQVTS